MHEITRPYLVGLYTNEISTALNEGLNIPKYRGKQISEWLYRRTMPNMNGGYNATFASMTDLPLPLRNDLASHYVEQPIIINDKYEDKQDGTIKLLIRLKDGLHPIECVLLPDSQRVSVCLSTQAGCPMACSFCATGTQGLTRNLTSGEIVAQYLALQSISERRITHIVLMGMGEPLINYDNTLKAIQILNKECGISMRHITLSTVGIIPNIDRLAQENLQLTLAISLHAPNDNIRRRIVPVSNKYPIDKLIDACRRYTEHTHRRLTFEYIMLRGVNDNPQDAQELAVLIKGVQAGVNLIPYNPTIVTERYKRPEPQRIQEFRAILEKAGIVVTQRKERGQQIAAACGQLVTETIYHRPIKHSLPVLIGVN